MERSDATRHTLLGLLSFALGSAASALALWAFFGLARNHLPGILALAIDVESLITQGALLSGLVLTVLFGADAFRSAFSQFLLFLAFAAALWLAHLSLQNLTPASAFDLAPQPGATTLVTDGQLYWDTDGGVLRPWYTAELRTFERLAFDPERQRFLAGATDGTPPLRWIGEIRTYTLPPTFLLDLFRDVQAIQVTLERLGGDPRNPANLIVFLLGFSCLIALCRAVGSLPFPRVVTALAAVLALRLGIALIRFSWVDAPRILEAWFPDLDPSLHWLSSGWMPLALGVSLLLLGSYQESLTPRTETDA